MQPTEMTFCQSCSMPLNEENSATEKNGEKNHDYCKHCYENGAFSDDFTMEQMIDLCVPFMVEYNPELTPEKARAHMKEIFPQLKRWKQA